MNELEQLKTEIAGILGQQSKILDEADATSGGRLSAEQKRKFDELDAQRKQREERMDFLSARDGLSASNRRYAPEGSHRGASWGSPLASNPRPAGLSLRTSDGRVVQALAPSQRMADLHAESAAQDLSPGRMLHAILAQDFSGLSDDERKALAAHGGSDASGGYLLPKSVSSRFVDLARAASVVFRAGAQTLPMTSSELSIAGLASDPTGHWRHETVAIPASTPSFKRITLKPKVLAAIVPVSVELLEDASNAAAVIESALQAALALKLDQAALFGAGSAAEPLGVKNHPNINPITGVGALADYSDLSAAVGDILAANYAGEISSLAMIANPREGETLDKLTDQQDQPLQPTPWAAALRKLWTTSLPVTEGGGGNESSMIVGDFSQMLVAMRTSGVVIEVLREGTVTDAAGDDWNATSQLMRHVRAYLRADVALLRPEHFTVLSGVTA